MQRNTINRPFVFSERFKVRRPRYNRGERLLREALWIIAIISIAMIVLDDVARFHGL